MKRTLKKRKYRIPEIEYEKTLQALPYGKLL